jgi:hypothetical protein
MNNNEENANFQYIKPIDSKNYFQNSLNQNNNILVNQKNNNLIKNNENNSYQNNYLKSNDNYQNNFENVLNNSFTSNYTNNTLNNIPLNNNTLNITSNNNTSNNIIRAPKLFETICQIMSTNPLKHWTYKELRLILNSPPYKGKIFDHNKNQFYDTVNDRNVYICLGKKKDTFEVILFLTLER